MYMTTIEQDDTIKEKYGEPIKNGEKNFVVIPKGEFFEELKVVLCKDCREYEDEIFDPIHTAIEHIVHKFDLNIDTTAFTSELIQNTIIPELSNDSNTAFVEMYDEY